MGVICSNENKEKKFEVSKETPVPVIVTKQKDKNSQKDIEEIQISNQNYVGEATEKFKSKYKIVENLGFGTMGKWYKLINKITNEPRYLKMVKINRFEKDHLKEYINDIKFLPILDHPNILKMIEFYKDDDYLYLISEYFEGIDLYEFLRKTVSFSESEAAIIMEQLFSSLFYLHSKNIIHRNINPDVILVNSNPQTKEINIKINDFCTCSFYKPGSKISTELTPLYYLSPEGIKKNFALKSDLWSCGVIMYLLLSGTQPFEGENNEEISKKILAGRFEFNNNSWVTISKEAKVLISLLLKYDTNLRISAEEAWNNQWIQKFKKMKLNGSPNRDLLKNLKEFSNLKKFQQLVVSYMIHQFSSEEQTRELTKTFKSFDKNGDGRLSYKEIKEGFLKMYKNEDISESEFEFLVSKVDLNHDSFIEYGEFIRVFSDLDKIINKQNLKSAFDFFDKDHSGKLSASEVKAMLNVTDKTNENYLIVKIIGEIDENSDGQISFEEFYSLMVKCIKK